MARRSRARFLALGVNGVGVALMIVVFAHTGGLVGAEVGVAGGAALPSPRGLGGGFRGPASRRVAENAQGGLAAPGPARSSGGIPGDHPGGGAPVVTPR